jgi:hypothetical protein
MERIPASERTREKLKALMGGRSEVEDGRSELVRLAARLIIEGYWRAMPRMPWLGITMPVGRGRAQAIATGTERGG